MAYTGQDSSFLMALVAQLGLSVAFLMVIASAVVSGIERW